jgi:hypothetical protein
MSSTQIRTSPTPLKDAEDSHRRTPDNARALEQRDPPPHRRRWDLPQPVGDHPPRRCGPGRADRRVDRATPLHGHRTTYQGTSDSRRWRHAHRHHRTRPNGDRRVASARIFPVIVFYTITVDAALLGSFTRRPRTQAIGAGTRLGAPSAVVSTGRRPGNMGTRSKGPSFPTVR